MLSRAGRYQEVSRFQGPFSLKVKEVLVDDRRYIVCLNERQARKDAADRKAIIDVSQGEARKRPQIARR